MGAADDLIAELASEGRTDSEGAFTLDRDKARDKMRQFQLADPVRYVLELVQAAVIKGATRVRFDIDADDMRMRFDGRRFTVDDFEHVYGALLSGSTSSEVEARRELGLGLNAAMALNPRYVRVESGDAEGSAFLEMRPGRDDQYGALETAVEGTTIHVKQRFRPGLLVEFIKDLAGTLAEERVLRERCIHCPITIDLEGVGISHGIELREALATSAFETDEVRGIIGLSPALLDLHAGRVDHVGNEIHLLTNGVLIATHDLHGVLPGLLGVVEGKRLRKDVSQSDIVQDEAYSRLVQTLRDHQLDLLEELICRAVSLEVPRALLEQLLRWHLAEPTTSIQPLLDILTRPEDDLGRHLLRVELWTSIRREAISLEDLLRDFQEHGDVAVSRVLGKHFPREQRDVVLWTEEQDDQGLLDRLFPQQVKDWTDTVMRSARRERNRRAWLRRPIRLRLPKGMYLARKKLEGEGIGGVVGVRSLATEDLHLTLIKDGCLLAEHHIPFSVLGLCAVVEADFEPNDVFDDVVHDETYARAMLAVLEALIPLFHEVAGSPRQDQWTTACLLSFLEALCTRVPLWNALEELDVSSAHAREVAARPTKTWNIHKMLRASPDAGPSEHHAIRHVPLVPTWGGAPVSAEAIRQDLQTRGHVRFVDEDLPRLGHPEVIPEETWARAAELAYAVKPDLVERSPRWDQPVLRMTRTTRNVLGALSLKWTGVRFDHACEYLQRAEKFFERSPVPTRFSGPMVRKVAIQHEHIDGELGALPLDGDVSTEGEISLIWRGRRLGELRLGLPFEGLTAIAESHTLRPNDEWDGAVEDEATGMVRQALARALPRLMAEVGPFAGDENIPPTVSWLLTTAAAAVFPDVAFRELYDELIVKRGQQAADEMYRTVLQLAAATSYTTVARTLKKTVWIKKKTDIDAVVQTVLKELSVGDRRMEGRGKHAGADATWAPLPGALAWLDELYPVRPEAVQPSFSERVLEPIPEVAAIRIFETVHKDRLSLREVIAAFREESAVRCVDQLPPGDFTSDRVRLLVTEGATRGALLRLFGRAKVIDDTAWLDGQRQQWFVARLPRHEQLRLPPGKALVTAAVTAGDLAGEVGLTASHTGLGNIWNDVLLCKDHIEVKQQGVPSPVALTAIIDDASLVMNPTWDDVATDPHPQRRHAACLEKLPDLAQGLAEQWPGILESHPDAARAHALDLLTLQGSLALRNAGPRGAAAWAALAGLPLLRAVTGELHSIRDLLDRWERRKEPAWYLPDLHARGEPLEKDRIVLAASALEMQRLHQLSGLKCKDYTATWQEERALLAWMASTPALPAVGEIEAVHRSSELIPKKLEGELVIPVQPLDQDRLEDLPAVSFGVHGHLVEQRALSDLLPCAGTITGPGVETDPNRKWIKLKHSVRDACTRAIVVLYEGLCDRFERDDFVDPSHHEAARSYLAAAVVLLVRAKKSKIRKYRELFARLARLPVLRLASGRAVSFEVALEQRPSDLGHLGLWHDRVAHLERQARELCEDTGMADRTRRMAPANPDPDLAPRAAMAWEDSEPRLDLASQVAMAWEDTEPAPEAALERDETAQEAAPIAPAPPTREEVFLEAIRDELRVVRQRNEQVLGEVSLEQLRVGGGPRKRVVVCEPGAITINLNHPVAQVALERFDRDATWVTFLASSVYTAINLWLEAVTDEDEYQFLHLLIDLVSTSRASQGR